MTTAPVTGAAEGRDPDHLLGDGWALGDDGLWFRQAARVVLVDPADRVLMLRAHDAGDPGRSWWFTVGGGLSAGEDPRVGVAREALEEVGLVLDPAELVGPVWRRSAVFDFARVTCRQDEDFYFARVDAEVAVDRTRWSQIELDTLDEIRWWSVEDLAAVTVEVYPESLVDLLGPLLRDGWDGTVRRLPDQGP